MKISVLILNLLLFLSLQAQEAAKHVIVSKVKAATIYLNGAELERTASVNFKKGSNLIVFKGLSPYLDSKSIRVSAEIELSILSISTKVNYLTKKNELPVIQTIKDSLAIIEDELRMNKDEIDAHAVEKEMIISNKAIGGSANGVPISELKQSADFFRQRMMEINKKVAKLDKRNVELNAMSLKYTSELDEVNARSMYSESEVNILVSCENEKNSEIKLQYMVSNAGWVPGYDIKADDLNNPIELIYKAKVFNNTGIAWDDVKIKLSIADPSLSINSPELKPWYLNYYTASNRYNEAKGMGYTQNIIMDNMVQQEQTRIETDDEAGAYDEFDIPDLNTEFEIKSSYSIPADDKPYVVEIEKHTLPATFKHFAVSKLDKGVFLLGRITGWENLNLVDGYANVYFKGTFLGQSLIKTRNVKDTLDLSLGRDEKVLVTRSKLKEYSSKQLIGTKLKETLSFELVAKNNRNTAVDIEILDQIPISSNSDIEVKEIEVSQADFNPVTGEVKWKHRLNPGESKKMILTFSIKYSKNQTIEIQQMKQRAVRKF